VYRYNKKKIKTKRKGKNKNYVNIKLVTTPFLFVLSAPTSLIEESGSGESE
jgi:hypothetical protein